MNDEHDPFELELQALRPHDISPDLPERVGLSLTADRIAASRRKRHMGVVLVGGLLAASLLIAALWPRTGCAAPYRRARALAHVPGLSARPESISRGRPGPDG
jgi:hypothetical protein